MKRLAVLGGSSPFTAPLFEALALGVPPFDLVLQGRNDTELALTAGYARARLEPLGWRVGTAADRRHALEGAGIVLQQARFGGSEGRAEDERLAVAFGIGPDETLGPAALQSILRMAGALGSLGGELAALCPDAFVLNLTNPLSVATSLLRGAGVRNLYGLCELPLDTARLAAAVADIPFAEVEWAYAGLNHRGFLVRFERAGESLMPLFLQRLGDGRFSGASAAEIGRLGAIPTKYYALLTGRASQRAGRAAELIALRARLCEQLASDPSRYPDAARSRGGSWYELAVVPAIAALCSESPAELVLNVPDDTLLTRELHCRISSAGAVARAPEAAAGEARRLLDRFEAHERAVLAAALAPTRANLAEALALDPLVAPDQVAGLADALAAAPAARCAA